MDSSSEGSFAWTDASNDTSDDDSMAKSSNNLNQSGEESESGKTYKKSLQQRLFSGSGELEPPSDPSNDQRLGKRKLRTECEDLDTGQSSGKKRFKAEPESDADVKKKKKKSSDLSNDLYDESFLNRKVKHEKSLDVVSPRKAKKNKKKDEFSINDTGNGDVESSEVQSSSGAGEASYSRITFEESFISGSSLPDKEGENQCNGIKSKKKKKSDAAEVEKIMQNGVEKDSLRACDTSINDRHVASADEQPDVATDSHEREEHSENRAKKKSKKKSEAILNSDDAQNHSSVMIDSNSLFAKRKSRMSARIQFEEDEPDVHMQSNSTTTSLKSANKLKSFLESVTELRPFHVKLPSAVLLTDLDDLWLIQCPKDVKPESFQDKKWVLDGKCKIKLDGQTYDGDVAETNENVAVLGSGERGAVIGNLTIQGRVRLRRRLPKGHLQEHVAVNNQTQFIPLPDTKCRHPLFGSHYKKAMKLPAAAAERLRGRRHEPDGATPACKKERSAPSDVALSTKKKNKKKKRKHSDATADDSAPRPKKSKKNLESAEAWDSEQAIEENLFNF